MAQYSDIIVLRILNFLFIYFMERIFKIYKVNGGFGVQEFLYLRKSIIACGSGTITIYGN